MSKKETCLINTESATLRAERTEKKNKIKKKKTPNIKHKTPTRNSPRFNICFFFFSFSFGTNTETNEENSRFLTNADIIFGELLPAGWEKLNGNWRESGIVHGLAWLLSLRGFRRLGNVLHFHCIKFDEFNSANGAPLRRAFLTDTVTSNFTSYWLSWLIWRSGVVRNQPMKFITPPPPPKDNKTIKWFFFFL